MVINKKEVHRIPVDGYGMGSSEYGEALHYAISEMKEGVEYIAIIKPATAPDDWDKEEKADFPSNAIDLILRRKLP